MTLHDLPAVNAAFNGLSAVLLVAGLVCIKRGHKTAHRNCMVAALVSSALFLAGYLTYHFASGTITRFVHPHWLRPYYLALLASHTVLAAAVPVLVIITVTFAARGNFARHKKIARWTWPIWMYVSVTGVLIYWLLYVKFPQAGT